MHAHRHCCEKIPFTVKPVAPIPRIVVRHENVVKMNDNARFESGHDLKEVDHHIGVWKNAVGAVQEKDVSSSELVKESEIA